jgi:hypothetical protein
MSELGQGRPYGSTLLLLSGMPAGERIDSAPWPTSGPATLVVDDQNW